MQVAVLAGGVGSRLMPWTESIPKPLLPMLDRTLIEQVIYSVPQNMIDEVVVAGGYKVEMIKSYFDSKDCDFDVTIINETEPLGTGGALGNCRDVLSGTFACFNGDIISSLDIGDLLKLHNKNGSIGSLGLWEVDDPTRFGIVGVDNEQKITQFKEKPLPNEVFSNFINAGSYIFNDDIFDFMPNGRHSLERDVFPTLADQRLLSGMQFSGYFIDAGTQKSWVEAVERCINESRFSAGRRMFESWFANPGKHDSNQKITGSMVDSMVSIGDSKIEKSTILSGSKIGNNCLVSNTLVGKNTEIGDDCVLKNVIIAHDSKVPKGTEMHEGSWPIE